MTRIEELENLAAQLGTNREAAVAAMVDLSRLYGKGAEGVKPDLLKALEWAEKAAHQDSPDGYLQIAHVVGSACIATEDEALKMEYASYITGTCDLDTLRRFGRADIAYNVGTVCEYMARYLVDKGREIEGRGMDLLAGSYYFAAHTMDATNEKIESALLRVANRHKQTDQPSERPKNITRTDSPTLG